MAWTWDIFLGTMSRPSGAVLEAGYAGNGSAKNNPECTDLHGHGPLPEGLYFIGNPIEHPHLGKFVLPLTPDPGNMMHGRSGFFIHGDNPEHIGLSSDGCIILSRWAREAIAASDDKDLQVIP